MADNRLKTLRQQVRDAEKALRDLPKEERDPYREPVERFERVLAYTAVVLETSDPDLLSDETFNQTSNAVVQITNNPSAAAANAGPWGGEVLDAVSRLPVARGRQVEQEVKDAATRFKQSSAQHLRALERDIQKTKEDAAAARTAVQQELTELSDAIAGERAQLAELGTEQAEAFRKAQEERSEEAEERGRELKAHFEAIVEEGEEKIVAQVAEMERVTGELGDMSGALALVGTSERYGTEAKSQRRTANFWAVLTIILALLAVVAAAWAARVDSPHETEFIGKLAIGVILGAVSRYTAIQSSRAREREKEARGLQLDLSAFGPFIEPLEREQQEEERVIMTRKTFGKVRGQDLGEDDPGPTPLSQLMRRKKARDEDEEEEG